MPSRSTSKQKDLVARAAKRKERGYVRQTDSSKGRYHHSTNRIDDHHALISLAAVASTPSKIPQWKRVGSEIDHLLPISPPLNAVLSTPGPSEVPSMVSRACHLSKNNSQNNDISEAAKYGPPGFKSIRQPNGSNLEKGYGIKPSAGSTAKAVGRHILRCPSISEAFKAPITTS